MDNNCLVKPIYTDFARVILSPAPNSAMSSLFELALWVRRDWWQKAIKSDSDKLPAPNAILPIFIRPDDLRIRQFPYGLSTYKLFNHSLTIDHYALGLDLKISAYVRIEQIDDNNLIGKIVSGSVVARSLAQTFKEKKIDWLWASREEIIEALIVGSHKCQLEIAHKSSEATAKHKLFEYERITRQQTGILWKQTICNKNAKLEKPEERVKKILATLNKALGRADRKFPISIDFEPEELGIFSEVRKVKENYINEQYSKPGIKINFKQEGTTYFGTTWKPKLLKIEQDTFKLLDYDETDSLIVDTALDNAAENILHIKWYLDENSQVTRLIDWHDANQSYYLAGIYNPDYMQEAVELVKNEYIWQPAKLKVEATTDENLQSIPASWVRYKLDALLASAIPESSNSAWAANLQGDNFVFYGLFDDLRESNNKEQSWCLNFTVPKIEKDNINRFSLEFKFNQANSDIAEMIIKVRQPFIKIYSPQSFFYNAKLLDPAAVPSVKNLSESLLKASLVFTSNSPIATSTASLAAKPSAKAIHFYSKSDTTTAFIPIKKHALISPISATGGNQESKNEVIALYYEADVGLLQFAKNERESQSAKPIIIKVNSSDELNQINLKDLWLKLTVADLQLETTHKIIEYEVKDATTLIFAIAGQWPEALIKKVEDNYSSENLSEKAIKAFMQIAYIQTTMERDPNHGLLPIYIHNFNLNYPSSAHTKEFVQLVFKHERISHESIKSVQALFPWGEATIGGVGKPLSCMNLDVFHRNLILEQLEYELAKVYLHKEKQTIYGVNEIVFSSAVRDQYCLAVNGVLAKADKIHNWLPNADYAHSNKTIGPQLTFDENSANFPKLNLKWQVSNNNESVIKLKEKTLSIEESNNWLEYDVKPTYNPSNAMLTLTLLEPLNEQQRGLRLISSENSIKNEIKKNVEDHSEILLLKVAVNAYKIFFKQWDKTEISSIEVNKQQYSQLLIEANKIREFNDQLLQTRTKAHELVYAVIGNYLHKQEYYRVVNSSAPLIFLKATEGAKTYDAYYDNLGIIRDFAVTQPDDEKFNNWHISKVSIQVASQTKVYYSISVINHILCNEQYTITDNNKKFDIVTQLIFSCDQLKVSVDGKLAGIDQPINLGIYGFYANIGSQNNAFKSVENWPRFKGIPFYVIQLDKFFVEDNIPKEMEFTAVFANPEALYAKSSKSVDSKYSLEELPDFIQYALINNATVKFKYTFGEDNLLELVGENNDNQVHWLFTLNEPESIRHATGITGRLANLTAKANQAASSNDAQKVKLAVQAETSHVLILGRLWPLKTAELILEASSQFELKDVLLASAILKSNQFKLEAKHELLASAPGAYVGLLFAVKNSESETYKILGVITAYSGEQIQEKEAVDISYSITVDMPAGSTIADGSFECKILRYCQTNYQFSARSANSIDEGAVLTISAQHGNSYNNLAVTFNFDFGNTAVNVMSPQLTAYIMQNAKLKLMLRHANKETELLPRIVQGIYYGFSDKAYKSALVLWIENENNRHYLAGILVEGIQEQDANLKVNTSNNEAIVMQGYKFGLKKYRYDRSRYVWHEAEVVSWIASVTINQADGYALMLQLHDQLIWDSAYEELPGTGYLQLIPNDHQKCKIHMPVQLTYKKIREDYYCELHENYYFAKPVKPRMVQQLSKERPPDIVYPVSQGQNDKSLIWLLAVEQDLFWNEQDNVIAPGMVIFNFALNFKQLFNAIANDAIPLNLCLEPEAVLNLPKLSRAVPYLLHRQGYGDKLRIDLSAYDSLVAIHRINNANRPFKFFSQASEKDIIWLLSPLLQNRQENQHPFLFEDNFVSEMVNSTDDIGINDNITVAPQTENLFVFNRTIHNLASSIQPFNNLLRVTDAPIKDGPNKLLTKVQIDRRILETGASGLVLHYLIKPNGEIEFSFIPSPFYEKYSENNQLELDTMSTLMAVSGVEKQGVTLLDIRLQAPHRIMALTAIRRADFYHCEQPETEHLRQEICRPYRSIRYKLDASLGTAKVAPQLTKRRDQAYYPDSWQPLIYLQELVAYANTNALRFTPSNSWGLVQLAKNANPDSEYFLPKTLDIRYGYDKPGAMFLHEMRGDIAIQTSSQLNTRWIIANSADFAMREPQQIKTSGCLTESIDKFVAREEISQEENYLRLIKLSWNEVLGKVNLDTLNLASEIKIDAEPVNQLLEFKFAMEESPLQLILQHNQDVLTVNQDDNAIPAYQLTESKHVWASMFIIANTSKLDVTVSLEAPDYNTNEAEANAVFKPYLALEVGVVKEVNGQQLVVESNDLRIKVGDQIFIPSLAVVDKPGPWLVKSFTKLKEFIENGVYTYNISLADCKLDTNFIGPQPLYLLFSINQGIGESPSYFLSQLNLSAYYLAEHVKLQFLWIGAIKMKTSSDGSVLYKCGFVKVYSQPKIIKFLLRSMLSPKIAGVLRVKNSSNKFISQRTLFFGDAASMAKGQARIVNKQFEYFVQDQEEIVVPYSSDMVATDIEKQLLLIKYLIRGQVIYATTELKES